MLASMDESPDSLSARRERQLAAILELAQEGVVIAAGGRLVYVNPFMERLTGHSAAVLLSRAFTDFLHPDDREVVLAVHRRRTAGQSAPDSHVFRIVTASGAVRWVNAATTRIEWDGTSASLALLSDITAQKVAQETLADLIRDQETLIASRTASLRQANAALAETNDRLTREIAGHERTAAKLKAARKKAVEASRAKSVFLANMSHEIRTPLNVILGMADMALRPDSREHIDSTRALEMIREAGTALRAILGDLLDLSRVEAGRLELDEQPFEPRRMLDLVLEGHAVTARRNGVGLVGDIAPDVPGLLCGDAGRLGQILGNLVSNALKFTPTGRVEVSVRRAAGHPDAAGGKTVRLVFAVRDTGIGIEPDKCRTIFQSFRQADASIGRRYGGTGLGLAICRRLVGLMGGRIRLKSEPGAGSEFSFAIPFAPVDPALRPGPPEAPPPPAPPPGEPPPLDILLAEDSDLAAEMVQAFLLPRGHRITRAVNGDEALAALALRRFDLVLMDIQMPGMDGLTATRAIREGAVPGVDPHVPIVALTAYGDVRDRDRILESGATDYLAKPVSLDRLLAALARAAAGDAPAGPPPAAPDGVRPAPASAPAPAFDAGRDEALENLSGDAALYDRLAAIFLRDMPGDAVCLRRALAAGDAPQIALAAHSIKGNAGVIGATPAADLARELEMAARAGRTEALPPLAASLFGELDRVLAGLAGRGLAPAAP